MAGLGRLSDLEGCRVGAIRLYGAKINGALILRGAHLDGMGGAALDARSLTVNAGLLCNEGFQADGGISLFDASIAGLLSFRGAHLDGRDGYALNARSLTATADMFCDEGFQADGEVSLVNAEIGNLVDEKESWPQLLSLDGLTINSAPPSMNQLDGSMT